MPDKCQECDNDALPVSSAEVINARSDKTGINYAIHVGVRQPGNPELPKLCGKCIYEMLKGVLKPEEVK